jgi:hypothetical protein
MVLAERAEGGEMKKQTIGGRIQTGLGVGKG